MRTYHSIGSVSALLGISWNAVRRAYESGELRTTATYRTSTKQGRPLFTAADVATYRDRLVARMETYPSERGRTRAIKKLRAVEP